MRQGCEVWVGVRGVGWCVWVWVGVCVGVCVCMCICTYVLVCTSEHCSSVQDARYPPHMQVFSSSYVGATALPALQCTASLATPEDAKLSISRGGGVGGIR